MKVAIAAALAEVQEEIQNIQQRVQEKADQIAKKTLEVLKDINADLADNLESDFVPATPAKWQGLFSIRLNTRSGIALNKRGSGVRRMVLVSFFKAEAERHLKETNKRSVIYAIEEPETAQHPNHQKLLIKSFESLAMEDGCQVLLTTHSPGLASYLPVDSIRYVTFDETSNQPAVKDSEDVLIDVAHSLGVTPDSRVKLLICVEGPTDISALKYLSNALYKEDATLPNLMTDDRVVFISMGGSTLGHWVDQHYLRKLNKREIHIYDSDVKNYSNYVNKINNKRDGSYAFQTRKYEIENYLHPRTIFEAFKIQMDVTDFPVDGNGIPEIFGEKYSKLNKLGNQMGSSKSKNKLAEKAFPLMTAQMIDERDPDGEVRGWMQKIKEMIDA